MFHELTISSSTIRITRKTHSRWRIHPVHRSQHYDDTKSALKYTYRTHKIVLRGKKRVLRHTCAREGTRRKADRSNHHHHHHHHRYVRYYQTILRTTTFERELWIRLTIKWYLLSPLSAIEVIDTDGTMK